MSRLDKEVAVLAQLPTDERVQGLKRIIPCATIKSILKRRGEHRLCRRVPDWFMVWFVIGLGLFCCDCYRQIFRWLQRYRRNGTPGRSTLCEARQRLGVGPLRELAREVICLRATPQTPGAFYGKMRLMAMDGFVVNVADTPDNARVFGRPCGGRAPGAFPQVRTLALCEAGTHIMWRWQIKPKRRSEVLMAPTLLDDLDKDMLVLWDRAFFSYKHLQLVRKSRAHLLVPLKKNLIFKRIRGKGLPDGSFLAMAYPSAAHREKKRDGILVRIIPYTFRDRGRPGSGEKHRLLTTLLDARKHPAKRLIMLYHVRWEEELTIDEIKTHQCERPVLRSQTPAGVVQEIYGLLLGHFVVRSLMVEAAASKNISPLRISFTETIKILRCRLPECPKSPQCRQRWYEELVAEVAEAPLEERRDRANPRVTKQKMSKWPKKRPEHKHHPQPQKEFEESLAVLR
jgi:hypothetical protein